MYLYSLFGPNDFSPSICFPVFFLVGTRFAQTAWRQLSRGRIPSNTPSVMPPFLERLHKSSAGPAGTASTFAINLATLFLQKSRGEWMQENSRTRLLTTMLFLPRAQVPGARRVCVNTTPAQHPNTTVENVISIYVARILFFTLRSPSLCRVLSTAALGSFPLEGAQCIEVLFDCHLR